MDRIIMRPYGESLWTFNVIFYSRKNRPEIELALPATELLADHDGIAVRRW